MSEKVHKPRTHSKPESRAKQKKVKENAATVSSSTSTSSSSSSASKNSGSSRGSTRENGMKFYSAKNAVEAAASQKAAKSKRVTPSKTNPPPQPVQPVQPPTPPPAKKFHQYSKVELLELRKSPLTTIQPEILKRHKTILSDVILDEPLADLHTRVKNSQTGDITVIKVEDAVQSDNWYKHIHQTRDDSRGNSPLTLSAPRPQPERKTRFSDRKAEQGQEAEQGEGIVLGPQRNSFVTGCHVTSSSSKLDSKSSSNQRRIGSGRILRHDSQDDDRGFRREIPQLSELRKEARERRTGNGFHNDRGNGYGNRRHHDFDDERDYSDRRRGYRDYNRDGLRRHPSNEEPEWFSAGPTSQSDTIELRGFDDSPPDDSDVTPSSSDSRGTDGLAAELKSSAESGSDTQQAASASTSGAKQTNGAPEPPPQEVATVQPDVARSAQDTAPVASSVVTREPVAGGSRFTRFFNSNNVDATTTSVVEPATLNGGSRRSSTTAQDFSYLTDLISPPKSPSPDVHHAARSGVSPIDPLAAAVQLQYRSQQQQQLNMHLSHADSHQPAVSQSGLPRHQHAGEVEAALKSLLLPKAAPSRPAAVFSDGRSAGGVRTLAELEGQQPPMSSAKPAVNQEAFNKLLDMIGGQSNSSPAPPQSATPEPMTHAQLQQECTKHLNLKYMQQQQQQQQMRMQQTNGALTTGADAQVSAAALLKSNAASSLLGLQAASPIMFGNQPPMHITAPAPIHAASHQLPLPAPSSLATHRGPSPDMLQANAQMIMQSALIKKQLQDQKMRHQQRQLAAMTAPTVKVRTGDSEEPTDVMTSTPAVANNLSMNPAFTPTSVIRKMANDKLDKTDDVTSSEEVLAPNVTPVVSSASYMPRQSRAMTSINSVGSGLGDASNDDSGVGVLSDHSADMSSVHLPNVPHNTPQSALSFPQQQPTSIDLQKVQAQLEQLGSGPSVPATGGSASAKLPRALFGQGSMSQPHSGVKGLAQLSNATPQQQQRSAQIQQQLFLNALGGGSQNLGMSGGSGGAQFGRPIVKAGAQPLNPLSPGVYRNTPQSQPSAAPSHVPQHNQFASVANLMSAAASANQRPIVGGGSGVMSSQLSPDALRVAQMQAQLQAANSMSSAHSRHVSGMSQLPLTQQKQHIANAVMLQRMMMQPNSSQSPVYAQQLAYRQAALAAQHQQQQRVAQGRLIQGQGASMTSFNASKADSGDLSMFLKQQVGAMPPLPNQREGVVTVEEIERRQQQTVTN